MTSLTDATVLVTGANGGLGAEFVHQALARGARRVYATARAPREWDDARIVPLPLDVTSASSIRAAAEQAGDTTIVINNAGVGGGRDRLVDSAIDDVRRLFDTNVFGALEVAQVFAPVLAANGGGALVDVHSVLSWVARGGAYAATKAAFWSLSNTLRLELLAQGTQVVGAHLGYTDTPMTAWLTDIEKADPADIVTAIYDGLEAGAHEVLADRISADVKAGLSQPLVALYPELAPTQA
jgi:NAD(P)-dependent dehydrogenase (short-subunit alcohol dehydrogenase family)